MKNQRLSLRISNENLEVIKYKSKQAKMTLTDYVTKSAMGKQIIIITDLLEVAKQIKAVGKNLNQLVTLANMGRVQFINLSETLDAFTSINQSLQNILERKRWNDGNS